MTSFIEPDLGPRLLFGNSRFLNGNLKGTQVGSPLKNDDMQGVQIPGNESYIEYVA